MNDRDRFAGTTHIDVEADVRYWEDAMVDGVVDTEGTLIPGRDGDIWKIRIDLVEGRIESWPEGKSAEICYKVCDQGLYWLSTVDGTRIAKWRGHYVPDGFLSHDGGYDGGDYIVMNVSGDGMIDGYRKPVIDEARWQVL